MHDPTIGDIDNDGCLEIAVCSYFGEKIYILDDPYDSTNCEPVGVREKDRLRLNSLELRVNRDAIAFSIPSSGWVSLNLYDVMGRRVNVLVNKYLKNGSYSLKVPSLSRGIYFVRLEVGEYKLTEKMILIK